jgi:hypothetical protein
LNKIAKSCWNFAIKGKNRACLAVSFVLSAIASAKAEALAKDENRVPAYICRFAPPKGGQAFATFPVFHSFGEGGGENCFFQNHSAPCLPMVRPYYFYFIRS